MKNISSFLCGVVTTLVIGSLSITALAASGAWTITVNPINIQVNGETFQPTNAQGNPVPVFAYNGTTYAPVRALAEAYGLEVWYDPESNMAAVGKNQNENPVSTNENIDESYENFKQMWEISYDSNNLYAYAVCKDQSLLNLLNKTPKNQIISYTERLDLDIFKNNKSSSSILFIYYCYQEVGGKNELWSDICTEKGVQSFGYDHFLIQNSALYN